MAPKAGTTRWPSKCGLGAGPLATAGLTALLAVALACAPEWWDVLDLSRCEVVAYPEATLRAVPDGVTVRRMQAADAFCLPKYAATGRWSDLGKGGRVNLFPLVVHGAGANLSEFVVAHRPWLRGLVKQYGVVVFRHFDAGHILRTRPELPFPPEHPSHGIYEFNYEDLPGTVLPIPWHSHGWNGLLYQLATKQIPDDRSGYTLFSRTWPAYATLPPADQAVIENGAHVWDASPFQGGFQRPRGAFMECLSGFGNCSMEAGVAIHNTSLVHIDRELELVYVLMAASTRNFVLPIAGFSLTVANWLQRAVNFCFGHLLLASTRVVRSLRPGTPLEALATSGAMARFNEALFEGQAAVRLQVGDMAVSDSLTTAHARMPSFAKEAKEYVTLQEYLCSDTPPGTECATAFEGELAAIEARLGRGVGGYAASGGGLFSYGLPVIELLTTLFV